MTYTEFLRRFPDNDACLEYLKQKFFPDGTQCPSCLRATKFHRISGRSAYSCQFCAYQVFPTAHTIFHKSTTSLQLWFWAIYLVSSSKCGISAKQLGREIGVTYKTAWRMLNRIRLLLGQDDEPLEGEVEADETFFGGKLRNKDRRRAAALGISPNSASIKQRQIVFAATARRYHDDHAERGGLAPHTTVGWCPWVSKAGLPLGEFSSPYGAPGTPPGRFPFDLRPGSFRVSSRRRCSLLAIVTASVREAKCALNAIEQRRLEIFVGPLQQQVDVPRFRFYERIRVHEPPQLFVIVALTAAATVCRRPLGRGLQGACLGVARATLRGAAGLLSYGASLGDFLRRGGDYPGVLAQPQEQRDHPLLLSTWDVMPKLIPNPLWRVARRVDVLKHVRIGSPKDRSEAVLVFGLPSFREIRELRDRVAVPVDQIQQTQRLHDPRRKCFGDAQPLNHATCHGGGQIALPVRLHDQDDRACGRIRSGTIRSDRHGHLPLPNRTSEPNRRIA